MSDQALFSEHWYRVKGLRPRLASDVTVSHHMYREVPWYVLLRASTGRLHRVGAAEFELISGLDGATTVDALWQSAVETWGADAPSQPEIMSLLADLHEANLLTVDRRLNVEDLFSRGTEAARTDLRQRFLNPLFMRFPLLDPDAWLARLSGLGRLLFSRVGALAWLLLVALAVLQLAPQWQAMRYELSAFDFFSPANGILFFVVYPLIKALHELAHGLAIKRFGGEVHEMGVALLVLLPLPYVDASSAAAFADKRERMLVGAAGILMELGVAAGAALIWSLSAPGWVHDTAFMVMLIGGLSTLIFNGNPLLKFDGYYVLADFVEIPNLADRSRRYVLGALKHHLLGFEDTRERAQDPSEAIWLVGYAVASTAYRLVLMAAIAYMLSGRFFFFGLALAGWILAMQLLVPAWRLLRFLQQQQGSARARGIATTGIVCASLIGLLGLLPMPLNTVARGIVWLPEDAIVRAPGICEVKEVLATNGEVVAEGQPLFLCEDLHLDAEIAMLRAGMDELAAERAGLEAVDPAQQQVIDNEIATLRSRLNQQLARQHELQVLAKASGRFVVAGPLALEGRFLEHGDTAAYVVGEGARTIRVALTQADIGYLDNGVESLTVRFAEASGATGPYRSRVVRQTPKAVTKLPSAALTTGAGGDLLADPSDPSGTTTAEPVFDLQLDWPADAPDLPVGEAVAVRFEHAPEPLALRLMTELHRSFLGRLEA